MRASCDLHESNLSHAAPGFTVIGAMGEEPVPPAASRQPVDCHELNGAAERMGGGGRIAHAVGH